MNSITLLSSTPNGTIVRVPVSGDRSTTESTRFHFDRQAAGSHEIWFNPSTRRYTTIPNHPGDMPEGTLRAILKQAGVTPEQFVGV